MSIISVTLTSVLSVVALFIIAKLLGHKQMSQLDFFDYITGITIGSIAAELATEIEKPLNPLISMIVYGIATVFLTSITSKFPRARKYINGTPTILMANGKIFRENLKKAKIDLSEFLVMCRQEGYFNLNEISTAVFEYNGRLTILPVTNTRPLTPNDMNMNLEQDEIFTEIIMDGRILAENLKRMGLDEIWLKKEIIKQGYKNEKDIFLCVCDSKNSLTIYNNK